ncbi:uncharacterized protein Z518_06950 [Rhinocladiella mackenziei CBS 650.93]|uniref:J domain-containing protein n=1 Tax=Rhinocladiella mackenziei CBS 650.93 TaxID=1442369 RepID=A0A0D2GZ05_9EURO|nr:uncharacterized protein Z518_06950 [Rhinocladiella mackenziei CBS 650.93]KIX03398.1 hypothetical protein Z518_06950 [Rhinocladiella mackenziei CBS 650.93]
MVKADVKRDYYADLDLPPTADAEEIKKQFRQLAKQYHPDRNPGHEVDVVPKFQAVQAAHEILSDPVEKAKYDAGRAKLTAKNPTNTAAGHPPDPYTFARSAASKPPAAAPPFAFPPPPKAKDKRTPFTAPNQKPQASSGADKFNAFTRAAPQSWDRARFDEARAEAARVFPSMRPAQPSQQMPPRTTRQVPTAPKLSPSSEMPHVPNVPPTSFPGLSRAATTRKQGYSSGSHGTEESPAPHSAYSYVPGNRGPPNPRIYVPEGHNVKSPPVPRARPAVSPLRHTRSSDHDMRSDLGGGSRPSSRYAAASGERTDIHGEGLHRSASVRNSPVDPHWDDRGPFGRPSSRHEHLPRHRSASPGMRKTGVNAEFSESSSSGEDETLNMKSRPKAQPRRPNTRTGPCFHAFADNDPALTGQFPSTNYTKIVDESRYEYPPPDSREPTRKPFPDLTSPDIEAPRPNDLRGFGRSGGRSDRPKYAAPFVPVSHSWSPKLRFDRSSPKGFYLNGLPSWAVPSSVFPPATPPRRGKRESDNLHARDSSLLTSNSSDDIHLSDIGANLSDSHDPNQSNTQTKFSAADWNDKVTADDIFRPTDSPMRKSPSKLNRTGSKPATRGRGLSRGRDQETSSSESSNGHTTNQRGEKVADGRSAAFQQGKLSDDWASKVKASTTQAPPKTTGKRHGHDSDSTDGSRDRYVVVEEDVMDVDETPPTSGASVPTSNGVHHSNADASRQSSKGQSVNGVDLREFTRQAPFAPSSTGLKDMDDLATHLPFPSRAENHVDPSAKSTARLRVLNLPKPPKPVTPPAEDRLDQANFQQYVDNMNAYMKEWNYFNARMIEHFRSRQDRVCGTMSQNWINMRGDGPDADVLDENRSQKAGYAAYMQWLKDDTQCREWWDHAHEKHLQCLEDLGRTREAAKKMLRPS